MKKSKYLKKSLAMLLALMLVVAMIPLSAAAAVTPSVTSVTVNDTVIDAPSTNESVSIKDPGSGDVTVDVELLNGNGQVQYANGTATLNNGVYTFTLSNEDKAAKKFSFDVYTNDNVKVDTYTVDLTYTEKSGNNSVASVQYGNMYAVRTNGVTYTVSVPYDDKMTGALVITVADKSAYVKGQNVNSTGVYTVSGSGSTRTFTVVAENGVEATYTVNLVSSTVFETFSVEGERKAAAIGRVTDDADDKTITVYMPYDTKANALGSFEFVPTFTTTYESVKVQAVKTDSTLVDFESGETYDLADFDSDLDADENINGMSVSLKVTYSEGVEETWTLTFNVPKDDPVAAITGLSVQNYQATISGTTITLSLPADLRKAQTVNVSSNNTIQVTGETISGTSTNGTVTLGGMDLSKDKYTLRVTAAADEQDGSVEVKDYTLVIETAEVQPASMTSMTLRDKAGTDYIGSIDQTKGTITFTVPYSVKEKSDLAGWKLFWTASSGSTVTYQNGNVVDMSGSSLDGNEGYLPNANKTSGKRFVEAEGGHAIVVNAPGYSEKQYTIVFNSADPSQDSSLSSTKLSTVNEYNKMNDTNSLDVNVSGKTLTVNVPYKDWSSYDQSYVATTLPAGAKLYMVNASGKLDEITPLNAITVASELLPSATSYKYGKAYGSTTDATPLKLVVASEAIVEYLNGGGNSGGTELSTLEQNTSYLGKYTVYELTLVQATPRTTAEITEFSVYNAYDKTSATGTINGKDITITLPYYYGQGHAADKAKLYVDFDVKGGETVTAYTAANVVKPLSLNKDGSVNDAASTSVVASGDIATDGLLFDDFKGKVTQLTVASEDNGKTTNTYNLTVKFAEAENGAELNSVSINGYTGTPKGHDVTITLPYGTEITSLVPTFSLSKNAYITDENGTVIDPGYAFNFLTSKKIVVKSESGVNSNTYTITVKVSEGFTDVNPGDWFYENVMDATENGYVSGMGDGTFDPMGATTRAQFASMIAKVLGYESTTGSVETRFTDVAADQWYAGAIAFCYENDIISGYDDGTFKPNATITRQEAAAILNNAFDLAEKYGVTSVPKFADDSAIADWATTHVYAAKAAGLMNGDAGTNEFRPSDMIKRCEAASIMMNAKRADVID